MKKLTHTDKNGKARMVDIGSKPVQHRVARASGFITLSPDTLKLIRENQLKKGDVLMTAQLGGIQGAKVTGSLIPLCHTITLENAAVKMSLTGNGVEAESEISCTGKTGVEMEALTAVSMALLTVYDMCKAVDKHMTIGNIRLIEKIKE